MNLLFETDRLLVKKLTELDADHFFILNSSEVVMRFIRKIKNRKECDDFLKENLNLYKEGSVIGRYAVTEKSSGDFVGSFSLLYLAVEEGYHIGYALLPEFWGRGYAQEIVRKGTLYFFSTTDKRQLFAITQIENLASKNVLLKAGFLHKGIIKENNREVNLFYVDNKAV
jgi:RimJ/RimL family protein N-acetyltransferase